MAPPRRREDSTDDEGHEKPLIPIERKVPLWGIVSLSIMAFGGGVGLFFELRTATNKLTELTVEVKALSRANQDFTVESARNQYKFDDNSRRLTELEQRNNENTRRINELERGRAR